MEEEFGRYKIDTGPSGDDHIVDGVPVRLADGTHRYVRWLGFMEEGARELEDGSRVKIKITAVCREPGPLRNNWEPVMGDCWILGCLVERGVYAVLSTVMLNERGRLQVL